MSACGTLEVLRRTCVRRDRGALPPELTLLPRDFFEHGKRKMRHGHGFIALEIFRGSPQDGGSAPSAG